MKLHWVCLEVYEWDSRISLDKLLTLDFTSQGTHVLIQFQYYLTPTVDLNHWETDTSIPYSRLKSMTNLRMNSEYSDYVNAALDERDLSKSSIFSQFHQLSTDCSPRNMELMDLYVDKLRKMYPRKPIYYMVLPPHEYPKWRNLAYFRWQ
jgi:hypothetical protein